MSSAPLLSRGSISILSSGFVHETALRNSCLAKSNTAFDIVDLGDGAFDLGNIPIVSLCAWRGPKGDGLIPAVFIASQSIQNLQVNKSRLRIAASIDYAILILVRLHT